MICKLPMKTLQHTVKQYLGPSGSLYPQHHAHKARGLLIFTLSRDLSQGLCVQHFLQTCLLGLRWALLSTYQPIWYIKGSYSMPSNQYFQKPHSALQIYGIFTSQFTRPLSLMRERILASSLWSAASDLAAVTPTSFYATVLYSPPLRVGWI